MLVLLAFIFDPIANRFLRQRRFLGTFVWVDSNVKQVGVGATQFDKVWRWRLNSLLEMEDFLQSSDCVLHLAHVVAKQGRVFHSNLYMKTNQIIKYL